MKMNTCPPPIEEGAVTVMDPSLAKTAWMEMMSSPEMMVTKISVILEKSTPRDLEKSGINCICMPPVKREHEDWRASRLLRFSAAADVSAAISMVVVVEDSSVVVEASVVVEVYIVVVSAASVVVVVESVVVDVSTEVVDHSAVAVTYAAVAVSLSKLETRVA